MSTGVTWACGETGLRVRAGADTHIGNYREHNEDRVHLDAHLPLALVLDGMGGQPQGERAAELGETAIRDYLHHHYSHTNGAAALAAALRTAHQRICAWHHEDATNRNAGACAVAALVCEGRVHVAWSGDSMAYLVRDGTAKRLTYPHNLRRALVEAGRMSESEANEMRGGFQLWLYLGCSEFRSDAVSFDPRPGDQLVLLCDGIYNLLGEDEIAAVCGAAPDPTSCAEALIELALGTGSRDNCTAAVLTFDQPDSGAPEPEPPAPAPRKWRWQFWK
jgi:serine/threonine protein phosphatase PrpC